MFPPEFDYYRAESIEEALDLLADEHAHVLAGGQSMVPELKTGRANPGTLVDVGALDSLRGIEVGDGETSVGALTTYATLAGSDHLWRRAPALAEAATKLGDRQVRNRGTVGGNLAQADPDGDLPAAALAADATVLVQGENGEREVDAGEFFLGDGETDVGETELISAVRLSHVDAADAMVDGTGGAYAKKEHPATGYAMVGVAAAVRVAGGDVSDARVAANGVGSRPVRLRPIESEFAGKSPDGVAIEMAAGRAGDDLDPAGIPSDPYASGKYRANVLETYASRALRRAVERAGSDVSGQAIGGDHR